MVLMLVGVKDVGAEFKEQAGDAGDQARLILAVEEQYGSFKVLAGHASRVMERRPMGAESKQAKAFWRRLVGLRLGWACRAGPLWLGENDPGSVRRRVGRKLVAQAAGKVGDHAQFSGDRLRKRLRGQSKL